MVRVSCFLCIFLSLVSIVTKILADVKTYLEILSLLRSNVRKHYDSEERFLERFQKLHTKAATAINNHPKLLQPFIIKLQSNCNHKCHEAIQSHFTEHRYDIVNERYGLLTTTHQEFQRFSHISRIAETTVSLGASSSPFVVTMKDMIEDILPMQPELKVSGEVRDMASDLKSNCEKEQAAVAKSGENLKLRFVLHGMTKAEFATFHDRLMTEVNRFNGVIRIEQLEYPVKLSEDGNVVVDGAEDNTSERIYGTVKVGDCAILQDISTILAGQSEVLWVERAYPAYHHNRWSRGLCDSGITEYTPLDDNGITGAGEVVGISDTGIDMKHCFFYDQSVPTPYQFSAASKVNMNHRKVVQYYVVADKYDSTEGHGTHVSGTVAGLAYDNYGDYDRLKGMVHDAKIAFADLGRGDTTSSSLTLPSSLSGMFQIQAQSGAKIFTNSWGTLSNAYDSLAQQVDTYMWSNPDSLVIFSAGNSGASGGNTVGSPSVNKNGLSIGASLNDYQSWQSLQGPNAPSHLNKDGVAFFSSQGPTTDRRLKPDILAPGYFVFSSKGTYNQTNVHCDIQGLSGTSMAAPTAAGFAVKARQFYTMGYYPSGSKNSGDSFTPSGALIKATLIHSGQKMTNLVTDASKYTTLSSYPSTIQGYGRIQLNKVLNFGPSTTSPITMFVVGAASSSNARYAQLSTTGESKTYNFTTSASSTQPSIRLTFCYTDYFGTTSSSNALINTLTVSIKSSRGNSFVPYLPSNIVVSNTQVIDITNPTPATTYTVTVKANSINRSPQPFAMVITGSLTYLNGTLPSEKYGQSTADQGRPKINYNTTVYIVILAIFTALLFCLLIYFYHIIKTRRSHQNKSQSDFNIRDVEEQKKVKSPAKTSNSNGGGSKATNMFSRR